MPPNPPLFFYLLHIDLTEFSLFLQRIINSLLSLRTIIILLRVSPTYFSFFQSNSQPTNFCFYFMRFYLFLTSSCLHPLNFPCLYSGIMLASLQNTTNLRSIPMSFCTICMMADQTVPFGSIVYGAGRTSLVESQCLLCVSNLNKELEGNLIAEYWALFRKNSLLFPFLDEYQRASQNEV